MREDCALKRAEEYDKTVNAMLVAVMNDNNVFQVHTREVLNAFN